MEKTPLDRDIDFFKFMITVNLAVLGYLLVLDGSNLLAETGKLHKFIILSGGGLTLALVGYLIVHEFYELKTILSLCKVFSVICLLTPIGFSVYIAA